MTVWIVATDLLREAASRKWFLALGIGLTAVLGVIAFGLQMDVVDGALAASRLFGHLLSADIRAVDSALRPVFQVATFFVFYGGIVFGIVACSDFAPDLLSPGRIEHLLALPIRRWELLLGTFLGVLVLGAAGALYAAGGLTVILAVKTGVWSARPVIGALLATVAFAAVYAGMLTSAVFARSAAISAGVGVVLTVLGIVASHRTDLAPLFDAGWSRQGFLAFTLPFPRLSTLESACESIALARALDGGFARLLAGFGAFTAALLAVGIWRFDQRDF
jgi:hypothetical protein